MKMKKIIKIVIVIIILLAVIAGAFALLGNNTISGEGNSYNQTVLAEKLSVDMDNWNYDEDNDIYYQIGLVYCLNPEDTAYESCGIYVPGDYFTSTKNSNGTYSCKINENSQVGNYSASSAPIVIPVNTPGYSSCSAPTSYSAGEVKDYTDAGFIYLNAGCRGRDNGEAPDGITDLKSAVTYYRFNGDVLPGDSEKIFTFGHSGGGAQSAIMGASGDSDLYNPYLENIGAAMVDKDGNALSNTIYGSMCWCPITNLDVADEAYEWNMGQYERTDGTFSKALSDDLASAYVTYINELGLKDPNGNALSLDSTTSGSYYDYMMSVCEESLNNFLNDTTFPYTPSSSIGDMGGAPSGEMPSGETPSDDMGNSGDAPSGEMPMGDIENSDSTSDSDTSYETAKDYIDSLNSDETWIEYDESTNTCKITSLEAFVKHCKSASKDVPAFDALDKSHAENAVFGVEGENELHFDSTVAELLKANSDKYSKYSDYNSNYLTEWESDLAKTDVLNNTVQSRVDMYNPMYYICDYYDGKDTSNVAQYWRINSGIEQGDTALATEVNLNLALVQKLGPDNVEFSTVWGQGHTQAERSGDSTTNFINWINNCLN